MFPLGSHVSSGDGGCSDFLALVTTPKVATHRGTVAPRAHTYTAAAAASRQAWPTRRDRMDGSPPGFPAPGFSRQEHCGGLPFPSPRHESEKGKRSRSVVSDPQRPHGRQPSRLLRPWDSPGERTGVGAIAFPHIHHTHTQITHIHTAHYTHTSQTTHTKHTYTRVHTDTTHTAHLSLTCLWVILPAQPVVNRRPGTEPHRHSQPEGD